MVNERIGDPGVVSISWFGSALVMLGVSQLVSAHANGGLLYSLLVAGIAESAGAAFAVARGDTYLASIVGVFGLWLIGYYLLSSDVVAATPDSRGYYTLIVMVPLVYLTVPAILVRAWVLAAAMVLVTLLYGVLGAGDLAGSSELMKVGGGLSFASAVPVWYLAGERLLENLQLIHQPSASAADSTDVQAAARAPTMS